MGILSRMSTIFRAKMSKVLDQAEDPRETMDYSYEKQLELLRNVKRGIVEVVTSKRRIELQAQQIRDSVARLDGQARDALAAGREDLARAALQRKQMALQQLQGLEEQIRSLEGEQEKLTLAEQRLSAKVEAFRTRKEVIKAQYTAAEAQVRIGEAVSGLSEEFTDVGMAVERAEEKTTRLRAKAAAIDELTSSGMLTDVSIGPPQDDIGRELAALSAQQNVEAELEALKRQLPAGGQRPPALEGGR
ncbi:MAG: PspA/IM30 family protein [Chloroflexi bacterium]|nr:PspA/IM30 family protein [Chloroflexota bacterium]